LKGCKNDVESIVLFLEDTFTKPSIKRLINKEATGQRIRDAFKTHLSDNGDIKQGDVMVFYFAGHGSRVEAPEGWVTPDGRIETICPCDQAPLNPAPAPEPGSRVGRGGIPDHEINVWLRKLAEKHANNNIVRICFC
jgi:Caspase domain